MLHRCPRLVQVWFGNDLAQPPAFSPDGRRVVLLHKESVRICDVSSGEEVAPPLAHPADVEWAAFSANGKRLVTTAKNSARVWDPATGKALTPPLEHDKAIHWATFSPDGARLATVSGDRIARIWDAEAGKLLIGPLVHDQPLLFASFSRDGKRLVTCGGGDADLHKGEIRVWDLTLAKPTARTLPRPVVVSWAYLTPDGEHVVAPAKAARPATRFPVVLPG